jgi:hypothetical protein
MKTGTMVNHLLSALFNLGRLCAITGGTENREAFLLIDEIRRKVSAVEDELVERRDKEARK